MDDEFERYPHKLGNLWLIWPKRYNVIYRVVVGPHPIVIGPHWPLTLVVSAFIILLILYYTVQLYPILLCIPLSKRLFIYYPLSVLCCSLALVLLLKLAISDPGVLLRPSLGEIPETLHSRISSLRGGANAINQMTIGVPTVVEEVSIDSLNLSKLVPNRRAKRQVYCEQCEFIVQPGVAHCTECGCCVVGYDHHCPWVSKCVGANNFNLFWFWLVSLVSGIIILLALALQAATYCQI